MSGSRTEALAWLRSSWRLLAISHREAAPGNFWRPLRRRTAPPSPSLTRQGFAPLQARKLMGPRFSAGIFPDSGATRRRSEEHTSELQSLAYLVCRLLLEKKKKMYHNIL